MPNPENTPTPWPVPAIIDGGFSVQTRYLPCTNTRGSRIKAWRVDTLNGRTESVTVSFDYAAHCPHDSAALAWFAKHWNDNGRRRPILSLRKGNVDRGHLYTVEL